MNIDQKISNELKILALEAINNAGSGHSGSVLSAGDILYTLYTKHLLTDEKGEAIDRDRFVLSNGHACAGLYAILAGLNYFDIKELNNFRKFGGLLTGHPEIEIPGVDASTGPLGQGVGNAVGMAIAESILNARFSLSHYTYCMVGDGCLEEGVGLEALSIAGLYKLNKFILLYDKNDVTLDGKLAKSNTDDMAMKFRSMNFNVCECDGHNIDEIDSAIERAKQEENRPSVIIFHTIIGKDTSLAGSNLSHGKVFDTDEIAQLKQKLNVTSPFLDLPESTKRRLNKIKQEISKKYQKRAKKHTEFLKKNKDLYEKYLKFINNDFSFAEKEFIENASTRQMNNKVLNEIAKEVENILVLSADLSSSTKVKIEKDSDYTVLNRLGKNIAMGIREHAMGSIANGIALHKGFNVICSTFLTFSNYLLPAIRMASIMHLPVMFAFSHSSIYDTPDGITHIPVEQLDQLRLIPDVLVCRPFNSSEIYQSYKWQFAGKQPVCLILSRSDIEYCPSNEDVKRGGYKLFVDNMTDAYIISSGSELPLAIEVLDKLENKYNLNVVSMLSMEIFELQSNKYKDSILSKPVFVIESSTAVKYLKYTDEDKIFSVKQFGSSGDEANLKKKYGFTSNVIAKKISKILDDIKEKNNKNSKIDE